MSKHSMQEYLRVSILLPFCEINLPPDKKIYSLELADFLLDNEAESNTLALAERKMKDEAMMHWDFAVEDDNTIH